MKAAPAPTSESTASSGARTHRDGAGVHGNRPIDNSAICDEAGTRQRAIGDPALDGVDPLEGVLRSCVHVAQRQ
jgi:hypothetical protein